MNIGRNHLTAFLKTTLCALLAVGFLATAQAGIDPTGSWSWTSPGRNGGPDRKSTLKLKVEGDKVTATLTTPGRNGATTDTEIKDAKLAGDQLTFSISREMNGNTITTKYTATVTAESIKGKIESERNGQPQTRNFEAKKETATAAPAAK